MARLSRLSHPRLPHQLAVITLLSATPAILVQSFARSAIPLLHHASTMTSLAYPRCSKSSRTGLDRSNSASAVLYATSITAASWKSCAQPRFDEFAECTVGPWNTESSSENDDDAPSREVEEVMRSCGGAIQGIRELPTSLIFPTENDTSEERTYHNRADGGFVYADDGSYSAGPEQWDWNISDEGERLVMASLAFPNRSRMWLAVKLSEASEIAKCTSEGDNVLHHMNTKGLELSRPWTGDKGNGHSSNASELASSQLPNINWKEIQRVRMPNSNQAWSLARAKWEKQIIEPDDVTDVDDETIKLNKEEMGPLIGQTYLEIISQDQENIIFGDVVGSTDSINLHMLAVCPVSEVARSVVRCYDTNGSLKSVAFFDGSLSNTDKES